MKIRLTKRDADFSKLIRERDAYCRMCGRGGRLECAHIVGRRNKELRWDPFNALALCFSCHRWAHENPLSFTEWLKAELGVKEYNRLKRIGATPAKVRATRRAV